MTADTTTTRLGFLLQGTGNNNNAWGQNLNDQVIQLTEEAIAGGVGIVLPVTSPYVLSAVENRASTIFISGALTADLTIVVQTPGKLYRVVNLCTGNFFVLLKTAAGTAVNVPNGKVTTISVSSNVAYRFDRTEVGRYVYAAAAGYVGADVLKCDGTLYKRASLPDLFAIIGTTYGSTDSTNFAVPNAYDTGRFLRSDSAAITVGTSQSNQNKSHTHTGSGTTSGASVGHTHTGSGTTSGASATHTHTGSGTTSGASVDHTHTFAGTTATESATHTHTTGGSLGTVAVNNGTGASQGNLLTTSGGSAATIGPSNTESATHTHTYSGTTGGVSVDHTHTFSFTTAVNSVDHTHTYSFTTSGVSADHTHTYSFTTSTGSADGTEARPESLVGILCIRY